VGLVDLFLPDNTTFDSEDRDRNIFRNVGMYLTRYMVPQPREPQYEKSPRGSLRTDKAMGRLTLFWGVVGR
jgi:hypothetical protein